MTGAPVPERFRGAWRRVSIAVDGGAPVENADVVWVQTERAYADIRVPRPGRADTVAPVSFAGTTRWVDPHLHWRHELDLDPARDEADDPDVGRVRWDGADLVESGCYADGDRTVPYVEVWRRLPGSDGVLHSRWTDDGTGVVVRAGDHAVTIADDRPAGGFRACYRARRSGRWRIELALGDGAAELPIPPASGAEPGDRDELGVTIR